MNNLKIQCFHIVISTLIIFLGWKKTTFGQSFQSLDTSLAEVIVKANNNNEVENISLFNIINKSSFAQYQNRTLPEGLASLSGIFIQKTNHGGGSPLIRGLTGNQTLTVVDGIRFNNSTYRYGPNQYLNTIDVFTINKAEVKGGGGAVEYGSDALGGTLILSTVEPQYGDEVGKWKFNILGRVVSHIMEYTNRTEAFYSDKKIGIIAGFTSRKFGDLYGGKETKKQSPTGYKELDYNFKIKYSLSKTTDLHLSSQTLRQYDVPLFHKVKLENYEYYNFDPQSSQLHYSKILKTTPSRFFDKIEFIASYQIKNESRDYKKNNSNVKTIESDKVNTTGFVLKNHSTFTTNWEATTGVDLYFDFVNSIATKSNLSDASSSVIRGLYADKAVFQSNSIYTLHRYQNNHFLIQAGLRYNSFKIKIPLKESSAVLTPNSLVYNFGLYYKINELNKLHASFNKGYRAPNIDDLSSLGVIDFRYELPNYNLKPEQSYQYELGYDFTTNKLNIQFNLFHIDLKNLITRVKKLGDSIDGYQVYLKENTQSGYIRGTEFSASYQISESISFFGNVNYTFGQNTSLNEPLRRIPPLNGKLNMNYKIKQWNNTAEFAFASSQKRLAQGDKDDNRIAIGGTAGWTIVNLHSSFSLSCATFYLSLNNLLNRDYRHHGSGINGIGRNASVTINFGASSFKLGRI